jgi:hypothetical protein
MQKFKICIPDNMCFLDNTINIMISLYVFTFPPKHQFVNELPMDLRTPSQLSSLAIVCCWTHHPSSEWKFGIKAPLVARIRSVISQRSSSSVKIFLNANPWIIIEKV